MWGKSDNKDKQKAPSKLKLDTMIGPNTEINGDIKFIDFLVVDGIVNGNISAADESSSRVALNKTGKVVGDVNVPNIFINGEVEGDVYASGKVELAQHARIKGNVYYNLLEMEMGAAINGNLVHRPHSDMRLIEHKDKAKSANANLSDEQKISS